MGTFDNYDLLANGVVNTTYDFAKNSRQNPVDVPHLLFVLLNQSNSKIPEIIEKMGADINAVRNLTKKSLFGLLSLQGDFCISGELNNVFLNANDIAKSMGNIHTDIYAVFLSLLQSSNSVSKKLAEQGITFEKMKNIVSVMPKTALKNNEELYNNYNTSEPNGLDKYSDDLTQLAKDGKLKEVIGREKEVNKLIETLSRKNKNNAIVLGDSGVGKTSVVELLAQKIAQGSVPEFLKDKKIMRINLGSLLAGTKFRGEFEEKITGILKTIKESSGNIILFIDEFHNVYGAGKSEGSMNLSEILKPELSSGNVQVIGATTTSEYRQTIEKDAGFARRFENITVQEPSIQDTITILRGIESSFEKHHGVIIYDTTLSAVVELSDRYIKDSKLPDKAITILDQAATKVKIEMTSLPGNISEIMTKIGHLKIEKDGIIQEIGSTTDNINQDLLNTRIQIINDEIIKFEEEYNNKKNQWEELRNLFQKNEELSSQIKEFEKVVGELEKKLNFDDASKIKVGELLEVKKQFQVNNKELIKLQNQYGITIKNVVEKEDIAQIISEKTGIPLTKMMGEESEKLANLENYLGKKVIGQADAISEISSAIRRARIGLKDPQKPIGSFIFLGPTGVGKTELAKALAELLFFDKKAMVRFNMSEFKEEQSTSKLIGSPPGYVGYEKGGELTEAIRRKPYSVILLDEVEKAHQSVFDLFLQVFDEGMLNDSLGNTVDFKNTIIIMTSNIGSQEIMEKLEGDKIEIGELYSVEKPEVVDEPKEGNEILEFVDSKSKRNRRSKKKKSENINQEKGNENNSKTDELKEELQPILMDFFRPEFLNRLDGNIIFNPISPDMLKLILDIKLKEQFNLVYSSNKISLTICNEAKNWLAKQGRDPANGARPINRALQKYIIDPLSLKIVSGKISQGDSVSVELEDNKLIFKKSK